MTLVVLFNTEQASYMIGDILLSTPKEEAETSVSFPTEPSTPLNKDCVVVGLRQKIVQIGPGVMLGYAGYLDEAQSLLHFIAYDYGKKPDPQTALDSFKQFFSANPDKFKNLQCVIVIEEADQTTINSRNCDWVSTPLFGSIVVLGSGKAAFLEYLDKIAAERRLAMAGFPLKPDTSPPDADKIAYVVEYIVSTIKYQKSSGFGLEHAWGGGFEMAFKRNGRFMEKLDNVFYHTYTMDEVDGQLQFRGHESRTFQYYFGDTLKIVTQAFGQTLNIFDVPAAINGLATKPVTYMSDRRANLAFVQIYDTKLNTRFHHLEYNGLGSPYFVVKYLGGSDYIIDVKIWYLRQIALQLRNSASDGLLNKNPD